MTITIISGYFNPLTEGHLKMIEEAKNFSKKIIAIVNNDKQQILRNGEIIATENERMKNLKKIKEIDEVVLSIDLDLTVSKTLKKIAEKYPKEKKVFYNGGKRNSSNDIPEGEVCRENGIQLKFGIKEFSNTISI